MYCLTCGLLKGLISALTDRAVCTNSQCPDIWK